MSMANAHILCWRCLAILSGLVMAVMKAGHVITGSYGMLPMTFNGFIHSIIIFIRFTSAALSCTVNAVM